MVGCGDERTSAQPAGARMEAEVHQGYQQESAAEAEEGQVFGGSYVGPQSLGRAAEEAKGSSQKNLAVVVQSSGARLPPSRVEIRLPGRAVPKSRKALET